MTRWWLLLVMVPWMMCRADDAWKHQAYQQSMRLPDLHHAVDVELLEGMQPPPAFALKEGRLACQTCHGLEKMDELPYDQVDKKAVNFLRAGPYARLQDFCFNCHAKKDHERPNIHRMLDERGEIREKNCLYCHEEVHEKRDQRLEAAKVKLRLPAEKLCFGCHLKTPHLNALEHQGSKPKPEMKQHMQQMADKQAVILPLSEEGYVTCISCHSPHPEGVMNVGNPAGAQVSGDIEKGINYEPHSWDAVFRADKQQRLEDLAMQSGEQHDLGYRRLKTEVLLRMPAKDGSLCLGCHEFKR